MVVDLAVEDDLDVAGFVGHRLPPGGRQIDERQATVYELAVLVDEVTGAVGTAVREQSVGARGPIPGIGQPGAGGEPSRYTAHACS